jgi:hypothetical protein
VTPGENFVVACTVTMGQMPIHNVAEDFHILVGMSPKTAVRLHVVIVQHSQNTEVHIIRVTIISERKMEICICRAHIANLHVAELSGVYFFVFSHNQLPKIAYFE